MMTEETLNKLADMKMHGLADALRDQLQNTAFNDMTFESRIGLLVDREWTDRQTRRLTRRLQQAKLRHQACIEDIDYRHPRNLDRDTMLRLSGCAWVSARQNVIITGPTGVGKTYLACALAHKAMRLGYSALYRRVPRLLHELVVARADGTLPRLLTKLAKVRVLIVDDWGLAQLRDQERRDLLEVFEDRTESSSTIVASQLPVEDWHTVIGEPTVADALLDRLIHCAHRIPLVGESIRKTQARLTQEVTSSN